MNSTFPVPQTANGAATILGQYQNRRVILVAENNSTGSFTFSASNATSVCSAAQKINPVTNSYYTALENYQRVYCTSSWNGNYGTTRGHYRENTYGAFISDVWQLGHRITLNAGVRWEYNSPFVEQNGLEGTMDPTQ